eukprot:m.310489 g.310489  ORF g.310489 m.310489 type:complete len:212 (+) comp16477_c1_seq2:124-759(+)
MPDYIVLQSDIGQKLLKECTKENVSQPLLSKFVKQRWRTFCGIASSCIVLNAFASDDENSSNASLTEEDLAESAKTKQAINIDQVSKSGMTLDELGRLLEQHLEKEKYEIDVKHADEFNPDTLRDDICKSLKTKGALVANYHMAVLGQGEQYGGHHCPIGAYHSKDDMILLLDVWPDTEACWVKTESLYKAMNTIDSASQTARGLLGVSRK